MDGCIIDFHRLMLGPAAVATCLPHSKICVSVNRGLWDLQHGCADSPRCYGDRFDAAVRSLDPDIEAPITSRHWLAGRDPGLEAVAEDLRRRSGGRRLRSGPDDRRIQPGGGAAPR